MADHEEKGVFQKLSKGEDLLVFFFFFAFLVHNYALIQLAGIAIATRWTKQAVGSAVASPETPDFIEVQWL